jgi:hypothetical protein
MNGLGMPILVNSAQMPLPKPTVELVDAECDEFDKDPSTRLTEDALSLLLSHFPQNVELTHILLKVAVLNQLYGTNILAVEKVARHIADLNIDLLLVDESSEVVDLIANVSLNGKARNNFSFATKYCGWHKPFAYPIYDGNVVTSLVAYKKQDRFADFEDDESLRKFAKFLKVIRDFQTYYELHSCDFKRLDKFLWRLGNRIKSGALTV